MPEPRMVPDPPADSLIGMEMRRQAHADPTFCRWVYMSGYGHVLSEEDRAWAESVVDPEDVAPPSLVPAPAEVPA